MREVRFQYKGDAVDTSAMGATTHARSGGLLDWDVSCQLEHDEAAAKVEATLFPLIGTTAVVEVRPVNGARSVTNPGYNGTGFYESMEPVAGSIGQLAIDAVHILAAGALARSTA